jgi:hypothetical protein
MYMCMFVEAEAVPYIPQVGVPVAYHVTSAISSNMHVSGAHVFISEKTNEPGNATRTV